MFPSEPLNLRVGKKCNPGLITQETRNTCGELSQDSHSEYFCGRHRTVHTAGVSNKKQKGIQTNVKLMFLSFTLVIRYYSTLLVKIIF